MSEKMALQEKLKAMKAEAEGIKNWLDKIDDEIQRQRSRRTELVGGWNYTGLIRDTELMLRDLEFPIFDNRSGYGTQYRRVIDVTPDFVTIRGDSEDKGRRYRRSDGKLERSRGGNWVDSIDIQKAVDIWANHISANHPPAQPDNQKIE